MEEKIIFLDFDGVFILNDVVDPKSVKNLNHIIRETGAKIVVSSDWRNQCNIETLERLFKNWGIKAEILGITDKIGDHSFMFLEKNRTKEIEKYREENNIDNYIIIDDLKLYNNKYDLTPKYDDNFFETIWYVGLTKSISNKIISKLNNEKEETN